MTRDYNHVDAACIYLVEDPERYDVIVTDNLFGDIITDLAGAVAGGIGYAASANLNPARTGPVAVRAGARRRPRHRRHRQGQPDRRHPLGRPHARPPRRGRRPPAEGRPRRSPELHRLADPIPSLSTAAIGDAIAERL